MGMVLNNDDTSMEKTVIFHDEKISNRIYIAFEILLIDQPYKDRLCGLVVRVPGYKSRGPGSIPRSTTFSEKYGSGIASI
jgi:hypothetical protein